MAKVILNPAIQVISGDISGFVYRHPADGRVSIAKAPVRDPDYEPTPAQAAQMQKFKEALRSLYAPDPRSGNQSRL